MNVKIQELDRKIAVLQAKREVLLQEYYRTEDKQKEEVKMKGTIVRMQIKALEIAKDMSMHKGKRLTV